MIYGSQQWNCSSFLMHYVSTSIHISNYYNSLNLALTLLLYYIIDCNSLNWLGFCLYSTSSRKLVQRNFREGNPFEYPFYTRKGVMYAKLKKGKRKVFFGLPYSRKFSTFISLPHPITPTNGSMNRPEFFKWKQQHMLKFLLSIP